MRKTFIFFLVASLTLSVRLSGQVLASESPTTPKDRSEIAYRHASRLETNFENYYLRISRIIDKIQTKITDTKTADTSSAQSKLNEAKTKLNDAKKISDSAISQFKSVSQGNVEDQKEKLKEARSTAQSARISFVEALKTTNDSFKLLKSIIKK